MDTLPVINGRKREAESGATLIELMAAVLIVGILTAFLLPSMSRIRGAADSAKCVNNLRMIGVGIAGYVAEHDGYLPGPLSAGTHAFYTSEDSLDPVKGGRLSCFLQGYIARPAENGKTLRSDVFVCPAYARQIKVGFVDKNQTPYRVRSLRLPGSDLFAFGSGPGSANATPPQRLALLSGNMGVPLSQVLAIQDYDGDMAETGFTKDNHNPKWIPDHPVHAVYKNVDHAGTASGVKEAHPGAYRNALFLDFHVSRVDLAGNP